MARFPVNFPLISLMLLLSADTIDPRRSSVSAAEISRNRQLCNFNKLTRTYNSTDLLLCLNDLAVDILLQRNTNPNTISDRAYQDTRQAYPAYLYAPEHSIPSNGGSYDGAEALSSLLPGGLQLPNFSNLFNLNSFSRPGFNLFGALSSIAQYDDLKCVPRILCEVASGSMPGSLAYRQSSSYQGLGMNALFGLLTAFDTSESSPILTFGRAALLGITNRGHANVCYQEYSRCPSSQGQLISYLNNHNGGFFRYFNGNRGNYYRPQQPSYQQYYKNSVPEYKILQPKTENPAPEAFLVPEADRTGTGKLTFANSDFYDGDSNTNFFATKLRESDSSKIVFPKEKPENYLQSNRVVKSLNIFNDLSIKNVQKESSYKDHRFYFKFPQEDENQNTYVGNVNQINYPRKPRLELYENKETYVYFPHDSTHRDTFAFVFPNNLRN